MGGMAEVFLAKSYGTHGIGKFLAMKRILPQYSSNEDFISMFTEEAKICVNLSHSNIAKIYEFGIEAGQFFIVMELIQGKNLRQILSRLGKENREGFSVDQAVFIAKEVAAGLDHAHRCLDGASGKPLNIIHRDMSPQNIMVSFEGEIKVVDFGIAKAENGKEETKAGTLKGKFSYMSPEQASGEKIDIRTDVFSLGIVLWELLANKRLFASSSEMNTLKKIREAKIPSISKVNPKVPDELERILNIALAKDAKNRYQTCAEFYKDLNRFLNRMYPDFSSHDFSIFVKSLYADEVLANRNKYVEFSKLVANHQEINNTSPQQDDKTNPATSSDLIKPDTRVDWDLRGMIPKTSVTRTGFSQTSSKSSKSIVRKKRRSDLFSVSNLSIVAILIVSMALIVSQLVSLGDLTRPTSQSREQASRSRPEAKKRYDRHNIIISSNPPGAEIYINGKNTSLLTPGRVSVPAYNNFYIELRKDGYLNYKTSLKSQHNGFKKEFTLQKLDIGFLNISSKFSNTIIYINGMRLKEKIPIRSYRVPSDKTLIIKAVDRARNLYDERVVTVKPDQTLNLKLQPHKKL